MVTQPARLPAHRWFDSTRRGNKVTRGEWLDIGGQALDMVGYAGLAAVVAWAWANAGAGPAVAVAAWLLISYSLGHSKASRSWRKQHQAFIAEISERLEDREGRR